MTTTAIIFIKLLKKFEKHISELSTRVRSKDDIQRWREEQVDGNESRRAQEQFDKNVYTAAKFD